MTLIVRRKQNERIICRHSELTLFPLSVTPEGCNPESSHRISGSNKQGFTLIELLVVVLIISILSVVALPQYEKAVEKSRATEAIQNMSLLKKQIDLYILSNGYPSTGVPYPDFADVTLPFPADKYGDMTSKNFWYGSVIGLNRVYVELSRESEGGNYCTTYFVKKLHIYIMMILLCRTGGIVRA